MAESVVFTRTAERADRYAEITPQIEAVLEGETECVAIWPMRAVLKEVFGFSGRFYLAKGGHLCRPFQGPIACTRLGLTAASEGHVDIQRGL